ncbi:hypothetical protein CBS147326_8727 [Penicillium roqueforti]|nr:hypothetical protein CBS147326_8727 [Penicillium roqueforti]
MVDSYMFVPSRTKKGPLRAMDIELANMPCYMGSTGIAVTIQICTICLGDMSSRSIFRQFAMPAPISQTLHRQVDMYT